MDNFKKFSLYDEEKTTYTGVSTSFPENSDQQDLVEIDLSEPNNLYSMTSVIREALKDKPDDYQLMLYLVCGNRCSVDSNLFAEYLKDVTQPILMGFRGIIHFDFIQLFIDNTIHVTPQTQICYSKNKLHDTMKNFMIKPEAFKKFMQRFVDHYWSLNEGNLLPVSELENLGIKVETI